MLRSESVDAVLTASRSLARRAARVLEAAVAVELLSDDRAWLVPAALDQVNRAAITDHEAELGREPRSAHDPVFVAARSHGVVLLTRTKCDKLAGVAAVPTSATDVGPRAMLAALMQAGGNPVGLLVCRRDPSAPRFNLHDVSLLVRLADAASVEIARALAAREASRAEAQTLADRGARMTTVTSALSDAARVSDVVAVLTDLGAQAAYATGAIIARADPEARVLRVVSSRGVDRSYANVGDAIPMGSDHPLAVAARQREPVWLPNAAKILHFFPHVTDVIAGSTGALVVLPLRIEHRPLGVLVLRVPAASFDAQERGLLRVLARHAAHALERAEMYESERRAVRRLEHLAAASAALAASTDLTSTLRTIATAFVPAVCEGVTIQLSAHFDGRAFSAGTHDDPRSRTVKLTAHGETLGELILHHAREGEDPIFLDELVRRAAMAIQSARTVSDLRAAIDAREEFLLVAGHELRTPLTTLRMCLFAMRESSPAESRVAERQIGRLQLVVDELLDVSKLSAGRVNLEPEDVDLRTVVREVTAQFDELQRASGSTVSIEATTESIGFWDRFRVTQLVTNLLSNALKYGDGKPVVITVDDDGSRTRLSIRDRGIGIAADAQPRIFERFERAVTSREYAGFGVGLWICRKIAEAHGGTIHVESRPGAGSEFIVTLPKRLQSEVA